MIRLELVGEYNEKPGEAVGRRQEQEGGAGGRGRRQEQEAGAGGRTFLFFIWHLTFLIRHLGHGRIGKRTTMLMQYPL